MAPQDDKAKARSVIKVLEKIINGIDVPLNTKIEACQHAIEVLCHPDTPPPESN
ncbi:MAG: hypothetical protein J5679_00800 [Alphaproteobacteria bacterium]|nr:hypothetical protein [Alphaproteobacteria bacterium]